MSTDYSDELTVETFTIDRTAAELTPALDAWFRAHEIGFQLPPGTPRKHEILSRTRAVDAASFTGAYDRSARNLLDHEIPVATYLSYTKTLNVGAGKLLDAHLITAISVRNEYQGQGVLRRVISADLAAAQQRGIAVAALTATEAELYGRYGFGAATFQRTIEVDTAKASPLPHAAPVSGSVRLVSKQRFEEVSDRVYADFHAHTFGSIDKEDIKRLYASGEASFAGSDADGNRRFIVHVNTAAGTIDGYAAYSHEGWFGPGPRVIEVVDLVANTDAAYLALWRHLLRESLTDVVRFAHAPREDALQWSLVNPRAYQIKSERDLLWLRILDIEQALGAREWGADGEIIIRVDDELGLIDGDYRLRVTSAHAAVEPLDHAPEVDLHLDASALGSLYLGGITVRQLERAGRITVAPEAFELVQRLFAVPNDPYTNTVF